MYEIEPHTHINSGFDLSKMIVRTTDAERRQRVCSFTRGSGFDRFSANMFYTTLECLMPPLCEEEQLENKAII